MFLILIPLGISSAYAETQISDDVVVLNTKSGKMIIELFQSDAPKTTSNFVELTKQKLYDGTVFHRIIKDFMIQGGDPNTKDTKKILQWGYGGSDHTIPAEFNDITHKRGIVSMARNNNPNSASSQFFIVHKDSPFLDQKYTVFGRLATQESYDTLDKIANLQTTGPSNNYLPSDLIASKIQSAKIQKRDTIKNLLDQGEPQRIQKQISQSVIEKIQPYSNEDLGISFNITSSWHVAKTTKTDPRQPDITIFGQENKAFTPLILVFVKNSSANSLEDFSKETLKSYSALINSGALTIVTDEKTSVNGQDAWVRDSAQKSKAVSGVTNFKYRETVFKEGKRFYTITYANTADNFEKSLPQYTKMLSTVQIAKSTDTKNGGCLIATAAYGTELAPQIQMLREVRDNVVFETKSGTAFMAGFDNFYYAFSPTVSDWERQNPVFREFVKMTLYPMFLTLSVLNYVNISSEQEMIGYGLAILFVNVGLYLVLPIMFIIKTKKLLKPQIQS